MRSVQVRRAAGDMTDLWLYERTLEGWEIRDENRLLVAFVPDTEHAREGDARRIAGSPDSASSQPTGLELPPDHPDVELGPKGTGRSPPPTV